MDRVILMTDRMDRKTRETQLLVLMDSKGADDGTPVEDFQEINTPAQLQAEVQEERKPQIRKACFIATAAMGSELDPHVSYLRNFRDRIVLRSRYQTAFERILNFYYHFSPPIAKAITHKHALQLTIRYLVVYPVIFVLKEFVVMFNFASDMKEDVSK